METIVHFPLDNNPVRFTTCGRIFVLDAIFALSRPSQPDQIWEAIQILFTFVRLFN